MNPIKSAAPWGFLRLGDVTDNIEPIHIRHADSCGKDGREDENTGDGNDDGSDTQENILAAENSYSLAGNWAGLGPNILLLDVCYVTRRIGISLPHRVGIV